MLQVAILLQQHCLQRRPPLRLLPTLAHRIPSHSSQHLHLRLELRHLTRPGVLFLLRLLRLLCCGVAPLGIQRRLQLSTACLRLFLRGLQLGSEGVDLRLQPCGVVP